MISKVEDASNRVSPSARYIRTIALNVCLVTTLVLVFAELFAKGPLFVGDYVSAARINPWTQFFNLFKPVDLTSRNAGYGFRPYIVQWELGSSFVVSGVFASLFEGSEYAKLVILFYLVIGTVGMNQFLTKVLPYQITNQGWKWQASVRAIISLFYTLNPAVQQLVIKGYIGILAAIAFLPLVLLSYESLTRASTKGSMILRAMQVAFFVYLAATYSYPLLMVFIAIIFSEISYAIFRSDKHRTLEGLRRLSSVALFSVLLELPSIFIFSHESASSFLTSFYSGTDLAAFYYASSLPATIPHVLTLTSASWTTSYFQQFYPVWYDVFVVTMIVLLAAALSLHYFLPWNRLRLCSSLLLVVSVLLSLGANFLPNLWLFTVLPVFPEAFQFLPLVAFSISTLIAMALLETNIRQRKFVSRLRFPRKERELAFTLLVLALGSSLVPFALVSYTNLTPSTIPEYDQHAYNWLAAQPGDGRMLLIPPSYAVRYPFDANSYGTPVDYWTVSPPKPIIIDNGGSLRGLERLIPYALYTPNTNLLDYLLAALAVKYVVLRADALATYDVPYYRNITTSYMSMNFPFLARAQGFGPITIYDNPHFDGVVTSYDYPIVVEGNMMSLISLAEVLPPGAPILFTDDMTSQQLEGLLKTYPSPVVFSCRTVCPPPQSKLAGHNVIAVPQNVTNTFVVENSGWKYANVITNGGTNIAVANATSFADDFEDPNFTKNVWSMTRGQWQAVGGRYLTYNDTYQPYSLIHSSSSSLAIEATVNITSGFGAGIFLNSNSSQVTDRSYQVQLIPAWNTILLALYSNGTGHWIQLATTPLSYNTAYKLAVSIVGSDVEILLNGETRISANIPDIPLDEVGLFATQATAAFSRFRLLPYTTGETLTKNGGTDGDKSLFLPLGKGDNFVSVLDGRVRWVFLVNSIANIFQILDPKIEPIQYSYPSPSSLSISQYGHNRTFLVIRDRNTGGWILPQGSSSYLAYGYALAIDSSPQISLSYDDTYGYLAVISFSLVIISFLCFTYDPASSIARILKKRLRDPRGFLGLDHEKP